MGRDDDHTWAELVESFHASPDTAPHDEARRWPAAEDVDHDSADDERDQPSVTLGGLAGITDGTAHAGLMSADGNDADPEPEPAATSADDDQSNHFVPPAPPPLPRGDRFLRASWWGVLGSPALVMLFFMLQVTPPDWVLVGLVGAFVAGFIGLVSRLRGHHPDDPDSGAVV